MRYVRMWYIIPHTKTKRSRTRVHACTRARVHTRRLFFWDVSIRNSLRSNKKRFYISDMMEKLTAVTTSMMLCTTYDYHLPGTRTPGMYQVPGTAVRTKYSYLPYICMMRVPRCHDCYYHGVQQRNALVLCRLFLCLLYGYVYTRTYMNNKTTAVVYSHLIVFFLVSRVIP